MMLIGRSGWKTPELGLSPRSHFTGIVSIFDPGSEIKQFEKSETLGLYGSLLLIDYLSYGLV